MLTVGFSTIVDMCDDLSSDVADLLGVCIPMLPVEHVQPLVNLRIRLMSRPGLAVARISLKLTVNRRAN